MTFAEFEALTLPEWEALEERRTIAVRHSRFNAALVASMIYNSAPKSGGAEPIEVWDFLPGFERNAEEKEREKQSRSARHGVMVAFTGMRGKTVEQLRDIAGGMIHRMTEAGVEDADTLVREVFAEVVRQPLSIPAEGA